MEPSHDEISPFTPLARQKRIGLLRAYPTSGREGGWAKVDYYQWAALLTIKTVSADGLSAKLVEIGLEEGILYISSHDSTMSKVTNILRARSSCLGIYYTLVEEEEELCSLTVWTGNV